MSGGLFNRRDNENDLNRVHDIIMSGYGGFGGRNPFEDDYRYSVSSSRGPTGIGGTLLDLALMNTVGIRNPFRFPSWSEPNAGDLGAYGYSQFSANAARMGHASGLKNKAARRALSKFADSHILKEFGFFDNDEDLAAFKKDIENGGDTVDLISNLTMSVFGAGDFGASTVKAAKHAESLYMNIASENARKIALGDTDINGDAWKNRRDSLISAFDRAKNDLMYKNDSFERNEEFMRGFSDTEVGSILERVISGADAGGTPEAMKERFKDVGGAAIKTLEAFKDLFGSAEKAKSMLNQMTGGGWSHLKKEDFEKLTSLTRGLQHIGATAGISHEAVGGMLQLGMAGVKTAMGYSAADVAGGFVSTPVVNGLAEQFLAQKIQDLGVDASTLDPVTLQRMNSEAVWRATQFAGSSANKTMTAFLYAAKNGYIDEGSDMYKNIHRMLTSGDQESMAAATQMVAQTLNLDVADIQDPTKFKLFTANIASDLNSVAKLRDMATAAANAEDRTQMELSTARAAVEIASNAASLTGADTIKIDETRKQATYDSIIRQLGESNDSGAKFVLEKVKAAKAKEGTEAALSAFDALRGTYLDDTTGTDIMTNANAAAAGAVGAIATRAVELNGVSGARAFVDALTGAGAKKQESGTAARAVDIAATFKRLADVYRSSGEEEKAADITAKLSNGSFADLVSQYGGEIVANKDVFFKNFAFSGDLEEVATASRKTGRELERALSDAGIEYVKTYANEIGKDVDHDTFRNVGRNITNALSVEVEDEEGNKRRRINEDVVNSLVKSLELSPDKKTTVETIEKAAQIQDLSDDAKTVLNNILNAGQEGARSAALAAFIGKDAESLTEPEREARKAVQAARQGEETTYDAVVAAVGSAGLSDEAKAVLNGIINASNTEAQNTALSNFLGKNDDELTDGERAAREAITSVKNTDLEALESAKKARLKQDIIKAYTVFNNENASDEEIQAAYADLYKALAPYGEAGDEILKGVVSPETLEGAGGSQSVSGLVSALSAGSNDVVKIGGKEVRKSSLEDFVHKAAATAAKQEDLSEEAREYLKGLASGENNSEEIANLINSKEGDEGVDGHVLQARAALLNSIYTQEGGVQFGSDIKVDSVQGLKGGADLAERGFAGSLTAIQDFQNAVSGLADKADITTKKLIDLGEGIQKLVDASAGKAYGTLQQSVLKALESPEGKDAFTDFFHTITKQDLSEEKRRDAFQKLDNALKDVGIDIPELVKNALAQLGDIIKGAIKDAYKETGD